MKRTVVAAPLMVRVEVSGVKVPAVTATLPEELMTPAPVMV